MNTSNNYQRIVVGGLSGDSGKTVVSCGLAAYFRKNGQEVRCFKKGPDYIDTAWLSLSSGKPARNLDTYLMGFQTVKKSFARNSSKNGINIIEGNRGIFDGIDSEGTHSTAELSKLLKTPLIIVLNVKKVTRSSAAIVLGCKMLDPDLNIAGVILNQVAGERHAGIAKKAIEEITGIPVVGVIPKLKDSFNLPTRHLGLITPEEFDSKSDVIDSLISIIEEYVDIEKIKEISQNVEKIGIEKDNNQENLTYKEKTEDVKIGYFKDRAFSFYYPENLEALEKEGAELILLSTLDQNSIDDLDALYIGGGFPETNLNEISLNKNLIESLKDLAETGLPIYAECGGLIYLSESIEIEGKEFPLTGILPLNIKMYKKPRGHGYCEGIVDVENPYFPIGTKIRGHEFHYTEINEYNKDLKSSVALFRGTGCFNKRDGLLYKNIFASYFHIHALGTPEWAKGIINSAKKFRKYKINKELLVK